MYDYGVYMRLRYQTRVKDRAEIAYEINKRIFDDVQKTPAVDMAIPFVYSYRAAVDRWEGAAPPDQEARYIRDIPVDAICAEPASLDGQDVEELAQSIAARGLLQPIVVMQRPHDNRFDILAGQLRFQACKRLGWKTIPAVVRGADDDAARAGPRQNGQTSGK